MGSLLKPLLPLAWIGSQKALRGFFGARKVIHKSLGSQNYLVNPKRCLCPFVSTKIRSKCKLQHSGTVELNRLNDLSNLVAHLKTQHDDIPAALVAAARIEKAADFRQIGPEYLSQIAGVIEWNATQDELGSSVRQITDQGDAFEPSFELDTDEHAAWVKAAIAEFE